MVEEVSGEEKGEEKPMDVAHDVVTVMGRGEWREVEEGMGGKW